MSNPAVITLAEVKQGISGFKRLQIEDNIGEAIHLHLGPMRFDFTIKEFLAASEGIKKALEATKHFAPHRIDRFDPMFLLECGPLLAHLKTIDIENRSIDSLRCIVYHSRSLEIYTVRPVTRTPAYRFLATGDERFMHYQQKSYRGTDNARRLMEVVEDLDKFGYPHDGRHIILFEGQNIVRDGQHRIAALRHLLGNVKIPVMIFRFSKKAAMPVLPWRSSGKILFKITNTVIRKIKNRYKSIIVR
ncbi:MAG: hypothetical protein CSA23_02975 [Deltaproteobacteria bacterium]|nr:MAG: hypothetical protein CSA23_02975 [Deltaproteobacteria bacterium]